MNHLSSFEAETDWQLFIEQRKTVPCYYGAIVFLTYLPGRRTAMLDQGAVRSTMISYLLSMLGNVAVG